MFTPVMVKLRLNREDKLLPINTLFWLQTKFRLPGDTGFTAVELLIAMAVFSFVLTLSVIGFIQVSQMYQHGVAMQTVQDEARLSAEDISRTLQEADHIRAVERGSAPDVVCSDGYKYLVRNEALYKQIINEESCDTRFSAAEASRLTGNEVAVLDFDVTPFNPLEDGSGYFSSQIFLQVGTAATRDLIEEGECEPGEPGSQFCAIANQLDVVTTRGSM
jgi:prepilin-type N-terminal cleavage/methylation domain-containing protein